jgi:hypothetical protein
VTFAEALAADQQLGKAENLAELLASGYTPTPNDCAALATLALNPSTKLRRKDAQRDTERRALALAFYSALRPCGVSKDDALTRTCDAVPSVHPRIIALLVTKQNDAEAVKLSRNIKFEIGADGMPVFPY